jgi:hypothetical protein
VPGLTVTDAADEAAPAAVEPRARPGWLPLAIGLGVVAVFAVVLALAVTSDSPGFFPDSSVYLGTARNLLDGRGLTTPFNLQFNPYPPAQAVGFHGEFPLTVYPPLYPVLLAVLGWLGAGLVDGARLLNAVLFGVNVTLAGLLVWRITRSTVVAIVGALGLAVTVNVVVNHALVMSEPLMIAIVLGGTLLMPRLLRRPTAGVVVAVGACAAAAALARMAGIAFTGTVVVAVLLWLERPVRYRVRVAAVLAALGLSPLVLWILVTRFTSDAVAVRPLRVHFPAGDVYDTFVDTAAGWLAGAGGERTVYVVLLVVLVALLAALGWFVATERLPRGASDVVRDERAESNRLLGVLALFVVAYVVVLYLTATLFDAGISVEGRLLVPIQVAGAVLVVGLVYRAATRAGGTAIAVGAAIVVVVLCAWPWRQIAQGFGTTSTVDLVDRGFQPPGRSALGDAVAALPADALVASTFPPTLYSASRHDVVFVPPRWDRMSGERNDEFRAQLVELGRILADRHGYLALYPDPPKEFATEAELRRVVQLQEVGSFGDGALYRVTGLQPGVR